MTVLKVIGIVIGSWVVVAVGLYVCIVISNRRADRGYARCRMPAGCAPPADSPLSVAAPSVQVVGVGDMTIDVFGEDPLVALEAQFADAERARVDCTYRLLDEYPGRPW